MWKIPRFGLRMMGHSTHCPNCSGTRAHWSRRKGMFEKTLLRVLAVRPYRCEDCDERYFGVGLHRDPTGQPGTLRSDTAHALKR
jgi:hypothetical protein